LLLALATSVVAVAITFVIASFGLIRVEAAVTFALLVAACVAVFYGLIRSGLNLRFKDPSLATAQAVCAGLATSYLVFEGAETRPAFLAFYLMALMFSVFFLDGPRILRIALFYLACYAGVVVALAWLRPETTDLRREVVRAVLYSIVLAWFAGLGWYVSRLRRRLRRATVDMTQLHREQRLLFDTANVGIALIRGRAIVDCNHFLADMLGYLREELVGQSPRIFFPDEESFEDIRTRAYAATEEGHGFREELILQRKDGTRITCDVAADALVPRQPESGIVAVYNDVSATRNAELQLHNALLEQVAIFDTAVVGIAFFRDRRVLKCNAHMAKLFGYSLDEMAGLSSRAWFESEERWRLRGAEIYEAFERGEASILEDQFIRKDGSRFWCSVSGAAIDPNDPVHGECVFVYADVTERKLQEERIRELSQVDPLTALPNRRLFNDRLAHAILHAQRTDEPVAVMLLDLDGFKDVNDLRGHAAGDQVLVTVAKRLRESFRAVDTVARLGGDEFVVVLEGRFSVQDLERLAAKAIAAVCAPIVVDGSRLGVGVSIGIGVFPDHADSVDGILVAADTAMYEAKKAGGNAFRMYRLRTSFPARSFRRSS
jgi:diguanylate cyclase (GGDEF)-like protein/PAS domain S-box-containing protein